MYFENRSDGGKQLARKLMAYKDAPNTIVIGLPRGGVITAYEIAKALNLPLDIVVPRKIGAPDNPEFALGAITEDGSVYLDQESIRIYQVPQAYLDSAIRKELKEAHRRVRTYRGNRPPLVLTNKTVILVDDGIATGATMKAAINAARTKGAQSIIVAVPVAPTDVINEFEKLADAVVVLRPEENFMGISAFYHEFAQTTDEEVVAALSS